MNQITKDVIAVFLIFFSIITGYFTALFIKSILVQSIIDGLLWLIFSWIILSIVDPRNNSGGYIY